MDEIIRQMAQGYIDTFKAYDVSGTPLKDEIDEWIEKFKGFAAGVSDPSKFYESFVASGMQEEHSALITKAAMQAMQGGSDQSTATSGAGGSGQRVGVREFLDQYRAAYDEIKKAGYRKRGEAAYERLFAVADRADDMLDAQLIFEEERLLWKIVTEDALDLYEVLLDAMDPLSANMVGPLKMDADAYSRARSDEELHYMLEKLEPEKARLTEIGNIKIQLAATLATELLSYCKNRCNLWEWQSDSQAQGWLMGMIVNRQQIRSTLETIRDVLGMSFDELMRDEWMRLWLLNPKAVDALARVKMVLAPSNFEVYRDVVENEILPDIPMEQIVLREPPVLVSFALDDSGGYAKFAEGEAKKLNQGRAYFRYLDQLGGEAARLVSMPDALKKDK